MCSGPNKVCLFEFIVNLVDCQPIGFHVAFQRADIVAMQRVHLPLRWQRDFVYEIGHYVNQFLHIVPALLAALIILFELCRVNRCPHLFTHFRNKVSDVRGLLGDSPRAHICYLPQC